MSTKFIPGKTKITYGGMDFGPAEKAAVLKVLDRNWWGPGKLTEQFENKAASFLGIKHAVFVNSGSSAFDIGIRALDLPKGAEVIIPACNFPTPISSIIQAGLIPVAVDIEPGSFFLDPKALEKAISKKTKAILLVYVAGNLGRLNEILKISQKYNLFVLEDNCDGFGGKFQSKMLGSFGIFSATSLHAAHIISTGGGGLFFTNDSALVETAKSIRDWGRMDQGKDSKSSLPKENKRYVYTHLGSNYQALELQAAMGLVQLKKVKAIIDSRQDNFDLLFKGLKPLGKFILLPSIIKDANIAWLTFPLMLKETGLRSKFTKFLTEKKIEWRPMLSGNIAKQPAFQNLIKKTESPIADLVLENGLWLPLHQQWNNQVMEYIVAQIKKFFQS